MISTPVTETYMVVKHAKRVIYMSHMEGLTLDKTAWKYTEQICGTQFQNSIPENVKMSESVHLFKQRMRNFLLDRNNFN